MKKILLVEDDLQLQHIISSALTPDYTLVCSGTIQRSFEILETQSFDLVLIDRMLPDGDALEIIKYIHETSFSTKIIALSQLFQPSEKVKGLESGADDYLPKPFSLGELKLKIKKAAHYEKRKHAEYFSSGSLTFFPESGEVLVGNENGKLRRKEADILYCLFRYKNRVVSRNILIDEVWSNQESIPTQTTLDVYIRRIRILLKECGSLIVTKRGFGYMLIDA